MLGHSHGQDGPVRHARRLIASGEVGAPRLIAALNCTDFLWRPRRPEELDTAQGGGVVFSQAAHQLDVIRVLCGGHAAQRPRADTMPARGTEGAYAAFLAFDGGAATATYSGLGRYDSDALMDNIGEMGTRKQPFAPGAARARLLGTEDEVAAKVARTYGGAGHAPGLPPAEAPAIPQPVRLRAGAVRARRSAPDRRGRRGAWRRRLAPASHAAARACRAPRCWTSSPPPCSTAIAPRHDGAWGLATLEACLALLDSARRGARGHARITR